MIKVRSAVIRLIKTAFQKHGISMPDEAREVVFPNGVPVTIVDSKAESTRDSASGRGQPVSRRHAELDAAATKAEGGLSSEAGTIEEQARQAHTLQGGENLLPTDPAVAKP